LQLEADSPFGKSIEQVGIKEPAFLKALSVFTPSQDIQINSKPKASFYTLKEYDLSSHPGSRLWLIRDVTEQKEQDSQLRQANKEVEENNRLKSAFISNMSHEIRTPMNTILGFLSLLEDVNLGEKDRQEYIKLIRGGGERLLNIINDIIDISRIDAGQVALHISDFDFNELAVNMFYFFKQTAEKKGLQYVRAFDIPNEYAMIRSDKEKIYSIFTNLINNAIKYTQTGQIKLTCVLTSNTLNFSVEDTGIGIPANQQQAVFDRYIQVNSAGRRVQEGSGLGLAITKAYVDMLGGKIWVESTEGKGSTFYLWLPIEQGCFMGGD
jgi:signal transduction histidine kinase